MFFSAIGHDTPSDFDVRRRALSGGRYEAGSSLLPTGAILITDDFWSATLACWPVLFNVSKSLTSKDCHGFGRHFAPICGYQTKVL
jgi:hypothetical protein